VKALVLGGSVFVGRHLVDALLADGHEVAVLNRGRTAADLPAEVERIVADRTDRQQMHDALAGRTWDAVFDVSGFVMAAGGSDIDGLLELLDGSVGRYVFVSSVMAYDQSLVGRFPWTEDMPTNPDGNATYGGFKSGAEAAMFLRLLQRRPVLVPHGGLVVGTYGHVDDLCAAMVALSATSAADGQVFNVSTESFDTNTYVRTLASVVGVEPEVVYVPDAMLPSITTPVFGHLFKARHHAMISMAKLEATIALRPRYGLLEGHTQTYEWFRAKGLHEVAHALIDPVWKASWDFVAEAELADRIAHG